MLCAKNLRGALAAIIGIVGLFGAGTAHAVINLDPRATGEDVGVSANDVVVFAAEKLYAMSATATGTNKNRPVTAMASYNTQAYRLWTRVPIGLEPNKVYYVRYDLLAGGVVNPALLKFDTTEIGNIRPESADGTTNGTQADFARLSWEGDNTGVIFNFTSNTDATDIEAGDNYSLEWKLDAGDEILARVESPTTQATYQVRVSIWEERSDAVRADFGSNSDGPPLWSATGTLMRVVSTVSASATKLPDATARVRSNFRKFKSADDSALASADLATVSVGVKTAQSIGTLMVPIRDPEDGGVITAADVLDKVDVTVTGTAGTASFAFGEFYLGSSCSAASSIMTRAPKPDPATDKSSTTSLTRSVGSGTHTFCANAGANDQTKATNPYARMPNVEYRMALAITLAGGSTASPITVGRACGANSSPQPCNTADAAAGKINREGTTVRIGFLTTASDFGLGRQVWQGWEGGSYNQRLVIVNHGTDAAEYTLGEFSAENGVRVTASDDAEGIIQGGTAITMPVRDLITITGGARTSAILTVNANEDNVSVATTQVTLPEGQTDTVRYHPQ